jgi:lycopene cyclase domain-containing protein
MRISYFAFLLIFLVAPGVILGAFFKPVRRHWLAIGLLLAITYVWTIPWDNWMAARGTWDYDPRLLLGIQIGWIPLEEYLFMGLMTVVIGMWVFWVQRSAPTHARGVQIGALLSLAALALTVVGSSRQVSAGSAVSWSYMGWLLAWGLPVIALQLAVGGRELLRQWAVWACAALPPALYLTLADGLALNGGTWRINPQRILNLNLPGAVPIEEGVFYLLTSLMLAQGLILFSDPGLKQRAALWLQRVRRGAPPRNAS